MNLSGLQRHILKTAWRQGKSKIPRAVFENYYPAGKVPRHEAEILGRSLERLVDRGLMTGYGHRTMAKWFIESVRLTPAGRRAARQLIGKQEKLPLK